MYKLCSDFTSFSTNVLFFVPGFNAKCHVVFGHPVSLVFPGCDFFSLSLFLMILALLKVTDQVLGRIYLTLGYIFFNS